MIEVDFLDALSDGQKNRPDGHMPVKMGQDAAVNKIEANARGRVFPDPPVPPWEYDSDTPPEGIGWMMGYGADYWHYFGTWFMKLSKEEQASFTWKYPEPEAWRGFYDSLMGEDT